MWERTFGQYVRILVDMDVSQPLRNKILVERKGFTFFVELSYENLPDYCTHCNRIGHYIDICKNVRKDENIEQGKEPAKKKKSAQGVKYVVKEQGKNQRNPIVIAEGNVTAPLTRDQSKEKAPVNVDNDDINKDLSYPQVHPEIEEEETIDSNSDSSEFVEDTQLENEDIEVNFEEAVNKNADVD